MDFINYQILNFTDDNLLTSLLNGSIDELALKERTHFNYFSEYLSNNGIGAKTIIIEEPYVSKSYLVDYTNYYSTAFQPYKRICKRVHFFNESFDKERFEKELVKNSKYLNKSYLGYIVVKPLPNSIIGPSLLKTYAIRNDNVIRHFPSCRKYIVSLFGKKLTLDALAYQEQDSVVAACASVSVWSAFHKTSRLFDTILPSPSEITKSAGNPFINYGRTFPNPGLTIAQICKAIESCGLVSEFLISTKFLSNVLLAKRIVYAYNRSGIPILLFIKFDDGSGHLVTINGYSDVSEIKDATQDISLVADNIIDFYAHDDQVGPYAKMSFPGHDKIQTAWRDKNGDPIDASIYAIIIPVNRKIRIKFQDVYYHIRSIDTILFNSTVFKSEIEWDIYLIENNKYKNEIIDNDDLDNSTKNHIVTKNYPKYIWVCTAISHKIKLFDFIYDSTDSANGKFCFDFNLLFNGKRFKEYLLNENFLKFKSFYLKEKKGPRLDQDLYDYIVSQLSNE